MNPLHYNFRPPLKFRFEDIWKTLLNKKRYFRDWTEYDPKNDQWWRCKAETDFFTRHIQSCIQCEKTDEPDIGNNHLLGYVNEHKQLDTGFTWIEDEKDMEYTKEVYQSEKYKWY